MKTLFLTNGIASYGDAVEAWLRRSHTRVPGRIGDSGLTDTTMISDESKFVTLASRQAFAERGHLRSLFADDSETNTVIIVPELGWSEDLGYDEGYEVAIELLNERLSDKFFNLVFVSNLTRDQLRGMVSQHYRVLVDAFPHLCLYDLPREKEAVSYSRLHLEMIRRIAVSSSGRLNTVRHNLEGLRRKPLKDVLETLEETIDTLSSSMYKTAIKDADRVLGSLREDLSGLTQKGLSDFVDRLDLVTGEAMRSLGVWGALHPGDTAFLKEERYPYRVLVVEDDPSFSRDLGDLLSLHFDKKNIRFLNEGKLHSMSPGEIADMSRDFEIVFLDLLLNDSSGKSWLPFSGLDIYKKITQENPHKVVRIMTGLPRAEVALIIQTDKQLWEHPPVILTKSKGWKQFARNLEDGLKDMVNRCEENVRSENVTEQIPTAGPFTDPMLKKWLKGHADNELKDAIGYSRDVLARRETLSTANIPKIQTEAQFSNTLRVILAHRRIALAYSISDAGPEVEKARYNDFFNRFMSAPLKKEKSFDSSYFTTRLGFNYINDCIISHENLFPFEKDFLQEGEPLPGKIGTWAREVIADLMNHSAHEGKKEYGPLDVSLEEIVPDARMRASLLTVSPPVDIPKKLFEGLLGYVAAALDSTMVADDKAALQERVSENENEEVSEEMKRLGYTRIEELFDKIVHKIVY